MNQSRWNPIIDAFSLLIFTLMVSTGIVLQFILPPGSGRIEKLMQGGHRFEKTIDVYLSFTRHEWGTLHLILSFLFLAFLILHLILHWKWIRSFFWGSPSKPKPLFLRILTLTCLLLLGCMLVLPWTGAKNTLTRTEFMEQRHLAPAW